MVGVDFYLFYFLIFAKSFGFLLCLQCLHLPQHCNNCQCTEIYKPGGYLADLLEISFIIKWRLIGTFIRVFFSVCKIPVCHGFSSSVRCLAQVRSCWKVWKENEFEQKKSNFIEVKLFSAFIRFRFVLML